MGIKWDLFLIELVQLTKEKSYLGSKIAICEYWKIFIWFCTLFGAKILKFSILNLEISD